MPIPTDPVRYERIKKQVKASVDRWPSAYSSGLLVKRYVQSMEANGLRPYTTERNTKVVAHLDRWFKEKWVDIQTGKPCGSAKSKGYYPVCRPTVRVSKDTPTLLSELTKKQIASMIRQKQKAQKKRVLYLETRKRAV